MNEGWYTWVSSEEWAGNRERELIIKRIDHDYGRVGWSDVKAASSYFGGVCLKSSFFKIGI